MLFFLLVQVLRRRSKNDEEKKAFDKSRNFYIDLEVGLSQNFSTVRVITIG